MFYNKFFSLHYTYLYRIICHCCFFNNFDHLFHSKSYRKHTEKISHTQISIIIKKNFNILGKKMIGSRCPRAVDRTTMRLGGNGMEENFSSSYLYDEWV
jgi:hypothetical protein